MQDNDQASSPEFGTDNLYREDSFTDRRVGTIRQLTPVTAAGEHDESRPVLYMGATQVMTQAGPMPLNFDIPAASLEEACKGFGAGAEKAVDEMTARIEEMRRDQASSIVVPGQSPRGSGLTGI